MVMLWEDITVSVADKKLLSGITGIAEAGRIMAVMGPSGCGKTTLLDSLAALISLLLSYIYYLSIEN